jgi:hypothetical protein
MKIWLDITTRRIYFNCIESEDENMNNNLQVLLTVEDGRWDDEVYLNEQVSMSAMQDAADNNKGVDRWSDMYQSGYDYAAICLSYIPDFKNEIERLDFNRGLQDGCAKVEKLKLRTTSIQ